MCAECPGAKSVLIIFRFTRNVPGATLINGIVCAYVTPSFMEITRKASGRIFPITVLLHERY